MKKVDRNKEAFFALLRAGLWEDVKVNGERLRVNGLPLTFFASIDWQEVYRLAEEQSVIGLVAAGLEDVYVRCKKENVRCDISEDDLLSFVGSALQLEQRNKAMNYFIGVLVEKMREAGIYLILVKGQGVAQCYERPLWRACGDVDFFLSSDNYQKAIAFLSPLATKIEKEDTFRKHLAMTIDPWMVELHGTMSTEISRRVNKGLDDVRRDIFYGGNVRSWNNGSVQVFLPDPDNDIIIVFTHFIQHFYVGGIGLRQICDLCRLLWTYKDRIDKKKLERRIKKMGLMKEWKAFAALSVEYLGMPVDAMPLYYSSRSYNKKAKQLSCLILETGNFGHNNDESYRSRYPRFIEKTITFFRRFGEFIRIAFIFPFKAPLYFMTYVCRRMTAFITD